MPYKTKQKEKKTKLKPFSCSKYLKGYLKDTLDIEKIRQRKHELGRVGVTDERKITNNNDRKVDVLDLYIFESMANLIYFFEFLNEHPELIKRFDDDIEDLLGLKPHTDPKYPMFPRFIRALIGEGYMNDIDNKQLAYRYRLLKIMQFQINQKAMQYYANPDNSEYQKDTRFKDKVWNELSQAEIWMRLSDKFIADKTKTPKRIIDF